MFYRTLLLALSVASSSAALGCGPKKDANAATAGVTRFGAPWTSTVDVDHPLVGRIWDVRAGAFVDEATLTSALEQRVYVLLGEKHDNPDHHRLQASLVHAMVGRGRKGSVAFEMMDMDRQPAIDAVLAKNPKNADAVAGAVEWSKSGWPSFALYRPIVTAALDGNLGILAANYPSERVKALFSPTPPALDHDTATRFDVDQALPTALHQSLLDELNASHCGKMPEAMLPKMVLAQRLRDGAMAERLVDNGNDSILITGAGHARLDRGVPMVLRHKAAGGSVSSVAFLEVARGQDAPASYGAGFHVDALPFDFVWFTPRVDDVDPCKNFHHGAK